MDRQVRLHLLVWLYAHGISRHAILKACCPQAALAHFGEHGRHELQRPWRIISSDACSVTIIIDKMSSQHTANVSLGSFAHTDMRQ